MHSLGAFIMISKLLQNLYRLKFGEIARTRREKTVCLQVWTKQSNYPQLPTIQAQMYLWAN